MLMNLGIIGCFIFSTGMVYAAVSILVDFAIPKPLRQRSIHGLSKRNHQILSRWNNKLKRVFKSDSESGHAKIRLKELRH